MEHILASECVPVREDDDIGSHVIEVELRWKLRLGAGWVDIPDLSECHPNLGGCLGGCLEGLGGGGYGGNWENWENGRFPLFSGKTVDFPRFPEKRRFPGVPAYPKNSGLFFRKKWLFSEISGNFDFFRKTGTFPRFNFQKKWEISGNSHFFLYRGSNLRPAPFFFFAKKWKKRKKIEIPVLFQYPHFATCCPTPLFFSCPPPNGHFFWVRRKVHRKHT